jgi:HEAT repeat protein
MKALRAYAERPDLPEELREKAIFWIGQSGGSENEAYLRSLYGRLKEPELRKKVLFSVSQAGGPDNMRWLLGVARDKTQPIELRKQALFWAGQGDAPIADLASLYTTLPERELREQIIFVYSQRDDSAAVDRLLEIARGDPDIELRKKALFWLGQSNDPRAAKALQEIIEQP